MGQRAYCDQPHPIGDAEADRWCEIYHWVKMPRWSVPMEPKEILDPEDDDWEIINKGDI